MLSQNASVCKQKRMRRAEKNQKCEENAFHFPYFREYATLYMQTGKRNPLLRPHRREKKEETLA